MERLERFEPLERPNRSSVIQRTSKGAKRFGGLWYARRLGFAVVEFLREFRFAPLGEGCGSFIVVFALPQVRIKFSVDVKTFFPPLNLVQQLVLDVLHRMRGDEAAVAIDRRA